MTKINETQVLLLEFCLTQLPDITYYESDYGLDEDPAGLNAYKYRPSGNVPLSNRQINERDAVLLNIESFSTLVL